MARWKSAQSELRPLEPGEMQGRRRSVMMTERTLRLNELPQSEHASFITRFYAENPTYPVVQSRCSCERCIARR